jgi:hypothetical protein
LGPGDEGEEEEEEEEGEEEPGSGMVEGIMVERSVMVLR